MALLGRLMAWATSSPTTRSGVFMLIRQYVRHVLANRPSKTVVTLIMDPVPGSRYKINRSMLTRVLGDWPLQFEMEDRRRQDSDRLLRKIQAEIELSHDEWVLLDGILDWFETRIDWRTMEADLTD